MTLRRRLLGDAFSFHFTASAFVERFPPSSCVLIINQEAPLPSGLELKREICSVIDSTDVCKCAWMPAAPPQKQTSSPHWGRSVINRHAVNHTNVRRPPPVGADDRGGKREGTGDGNEEQLRAKEENETEAEARGRQGMMGRRKINKANLDLSARKSLR